MSGADIANGVADALAEAGEATGSGPLICTLRRPADHSGLTPAQAEAAGPGTPTDYDVTAVQDTRYVRDQSGMLTGMVETVLMLDAIVIEPLKSDIIAVGVAKADVDATTLFQDIAKVVTTAPGGVAILYEVTLED